MVLLQSFCLKENKMHMNGRRKGIQHVLGKEINTSYSNTHLPLLWGMMQNNRTDQFLGRPDGFSTSDR